MKLDLVFHWAFGDHHSYRPGELQRLLAAPEQSVSELKMEPLLNLEADAKGEEVFELFDKYNLRSLTVIDEHKHPIGVITVDDVVSRLVKSQ